MRFKIPTMFSLVFGLVLISLLFANAAPQYGPDIGKAATFSKAKVFGDDNVAKFQLSVMAHEPAPALARLKFAPDSYLAPKNHRKPMIWNCRINHNYPFQIPGKAGPPLAYSRRE